MRPPLYILRHGQTVWNAEHRIQGRLDSALTAQGRAQARDQRKILGGCDLRDFQAFCSPQGRAFHTASLALEGLFQTIQTDARLSEISVGAFEGLRRDALLPGHKMDESEESGLDLYERAPGGEGFKGLHRRCLAFLDDLSGPAVLVTHGMTSRMLRLILLNMDISQMGALPGGQGVVYHLAYGEMKCLSIGA
ncbi:phosphoglycerate mutase GpmB [Roseobacter fucihabitans]|uniref:Phosphoglycerate mutase GpmB n=1 Tax=Roseobacter fucihabitans TaxID=1537242 RepID=A0ABZ2BUQ1_9RHOB|nr:histidine phosphatase family protein [Roseobacter litoralis]MBC6967478.1 putative phosphoserine phosphatase 2 [Roseobacter litoralis]